MKKTIIRVLIVVIFVSIALLSCNPEKSKNENKIEEIYLQVQKFQNFSNLKNEKIIKEDSFINPISGTVDSEGNIYIIDAKSYELYKFSKDGNLIKKTGRRGNGPGEFSFPRAVYIFNNKIYTFDYNQPFVNIFRKDLTLMEQIKFSEMRHPFDIVFLESGEIVISSATMQMLYNHSLFLFSGNGNMKAMFDGYKKKREKVLMAGKLNIKFPYFLCYDKNSSTLWAGGMSSYTIKTYRKDYSIKKIVRGDVVFKKEEQSVGKGRFKVETPIDKGVFFRVFKSRIYYGYIYNDEFHLDIIENNRIKKRFKSKDIRRILTMFDQNRFVVSFNDKEYCVGIVSIQE